MHDTEGFLGDDEESSDSEQIKGSVEQHQAEELLDGRLLSAQYCLT
jgi:hypothetical protein